MPVGDAHKNKREVLIATICQYILREHIEIAKFLSGFAKPKECTCPICRAARELMEVSDGLAK